MASGKDHIKTIDEGHALIERLDSLIAEAQALSMRVKIATLDNTSRDLTRVRPEARTNKRTANHKR